MNDKISTFSNFSKSSETSGIKGSSSTRRSRRRVVRRNYSQIFKREKVQAFSESSLSLKDFCAQHKLSYSTFHRWRQDFSDVSTLGISKKAKQGIPVLPSQEAPQFVSVLASPLEKELSPESLPPSKELPQKSVVPFLLHLGTGLQLSIPDDFHARTLQRIVQTLCSDGVSR